MKAVRLLVVDDAVAVRGAVRELLEGTGIEIVGEAADGRQGVELSHRLRPDVVLLDMRMPVMGGAEAVPLIRELSPASRIIAFTATPEGELDLAGIQVDGRLSKRAGFEEIVGVIRQVAAEGAGPPI